MQECSNKMQLVAIIALCLVPAYAGVVPATPSDAVAAPLHKATGKVFPDEYIIVFKDDVTDDAVKDHMSTLHTMLVQSNHPMHTLMFEYHIEGFRGYSAHMNETTLEKVRLSREVAFVERNQEAKALDTLDTDAMMMSSECITEDGGSWGLGRTTSRKPEALDEYTYNQFKAGEGVDVYVIDSGIETFHYEFGQRAYWGVDFIDDPSPETDENGHGTHVAGTILGNAYGIAKRATAIAVRVLNANGRGSYAAIIAGINYVAESHQKSRKSVCNMSVGGGRSSAVNNAVTAAIAKGVHFSVAAGNDNRDACHVSPASTPNAVTVAASDINDVFAGFSNWGSCVDIIAPGVQITSAWPDWSINTISGTSMAAPHVAGVMAKKLSSTEKEISPKEMADFLTSTATKGVIQSVPDHTPNDLVFYQCK